jgi:hypothetical protein
LELVAAFVLLQVAPDEENSSDMNAITSAYLAAEENHALLTTMDSVLVRPDSYLGHIRAGRRC